MWYCGGLGKDSRRDKEPPGHRQGKPRCQRGEIGVTVHSESVKQNVEQISHAFPDKSGRGGTLIVTPHCGGLRPCEGCETKRGTGGTRTHTGEAQMRK